MSLRIRYKQISRGYGGSSTKISRRLARPSKYPSAPRPSIGTLGIRRRRRRFL